MSPQATARGVAASSPAGRVAPTKPRRRSWRGILLDLTIIVTNLFLIAPLARLLRAGGQAFLSTGSGRVSPVVGRLFLYVFAAHALGAFLKRLPREARLAARPGDGTGARAESLDDTPPREGRRRLRKLAPPPTTPGKLLVGVACVLLLFHFTIFLLLLYAGWQGAGLDDWISVFGEGGGGDGSPFFAFLVRLVLICFVLPLPTALAALATFGVGEGDAPPTSWRTHWATELFADLLLYFSIAVLTVIMNVLIAPRFVGVASGEGQTFGDVLASLIPMALAFSIIYLPPRLIYLAEDYKVPVTWLTIMLALLSLAYRTFFRGDAFTW